MTLMDVRLGNRWKQAQLLEKPVSVIRMNSVRYVLRLTRKPCSDLPGPTPETASIL